MSNHTQHPAGPSARTGLSAVPDLSRKPRPAETVIRGILMLSAFLSVAITVGIIVALIRPVLDFFAEVPFGDFFATEGQFAVLPLVAGTFMVTAIALLVAVPSGWAPRCTSPSTPPGAPARSSSRPSSSGGRPLGRLRLLRADLRHADAAAGHPRDGGGFTNALAAGLVLGVMVIPTIASLAEDSMSAVPQALRQGSLAMGANRMQTTLRVVLPAALSGVAAAVVLGMSRAVGETMIVALAAVRRRTSPRPREGMQTMTGFIAQTAGGENPVGSTSYNTLFAVGLLLFMITLVVNVISIAFVRRFRQVY